MNANERLTKSEWLAYQRVIAAREREERFQRKHPIVWLVGAGLLTIAAGACAFAFIVAMAAM